MRIWPLQSCISMLIGVKEIDLSSYINFYQENCRIYLDEYNVEEVDLRVRFDTSLLMKRFMVKE